MPQKAFSRASQNQADKSRHAIYGALSLGALDEETLVIVLKVMI